MKIKSMTISKAIVLILCLTTICLLTAFTALSKEDIRVLVDDVAVSFDQPPVIINGRTQVPMRRIFEALDAQVEWDGGTKTVTALKKDIIISLTVGSDTGYVNGNDVKLDSAITIINDRTMIPARFVAESLNCTVLWQEETKTIDILTNEFSRALSVHFIDVGQADSILILLPNGKNMLIDAANNADGELVVNYLKNQGVNTISYLVGTHPHEDHIGGMDDVINSFNIEKLYMPRVTNNTKTFEDVLTAVKTSGLTINTAGAGVNIARQNGLEIDIIAPVGENYSSLNDYSAVVRLRFKNHSFLFMGDAEGLSESQITEDVSCDVLKVGHHGSDTSTTPMFLEKASPSYAVISLGRNNSYGHPSENVLARLSTSGAQVLRTDEMGTIVFSSDGNSLTLERIESRIQTHAPPRESEIVYITKTGSKYHREGCTHLSRNKISISHEDARGNYEPCSVCKP